MDVVLCCLVRSAFTIVHRILREQRSFVDHVESTQVDTFCFLASLHVVLTPQSNYFICAREKINEQNQVVVINRTT